MTTPTPAQPRKTESAPLCPVCGQEAEYHRNGFEDCEPKAMKYRTKKHSERTTGVYFGNDLLYYTDPKTARRDVKAFNKGLNGGA